MSEHALDIQSKKVKLMADWPAGWGSMNRQWKFVITTALCAAGLRQARAETPQFVTLDIEWQNWVVYIGNVADASQLASSPNAVTSTLRNFMSQLGIADIVSVNGKPAKGKWVHSGRTVNMAPSPAAGQGVGDVVRSGIVDVHFEILQADGTPIGSIMTSGFQGGPAPPGSPPVVFSGMRLSLTEPGLIREPEA